MAGWALNRFKNDTLMVIQSMVIGYTAHALYPIHTPHFLNRRFSHGLLLGSHGSFIGVKRKRAPTTALNRPMPARPAPLDARRPHSRTDTAPPLVKVLVS